MVGKQQSLPRASAQYHNSFRLELHDLLQVTNGLRGAFVPSKIGGAKGCFQAAEARKMSSIKTQRQTV